MSLLIKNVQILGGETKFPDRADLFVVGDRISAIGNFTEKKAKRVIDGQGAYLAPGFIDVITDSDHYLSVFDNPSQDDFLRQGVTTIIGGHCGSSLAPLLYGGLESIQKWADTRKAIVNWHTMGEFLAFLDRKPLAVNFLTLVGHSTIRRAMIGEQLRNLTQNELVVFGETLRRALAEGGAGLSTGLAYVHSRGTPYPEIKFLAGIAKERNGVYSTHLRTSGADLGASIDETIRIASETGITTLISHFMPLIGAEKEYEAALEVLGGLPREVNVRFDLYPFETSVLPLYAFLPLWVQNGGADVMVSNIEDGWMRERIMKDFTPINPKNFVIAHAVGNPALHGLSLADLMEHYSVADYKSALMRLMLSTKLRASIFYKNINTDLIRKGITHPRSFVSSNSASLLESRKFEQPERASKTFTRFLELVVRENIMPLEDAIRKITAEPAQAFRLKNRGSIREGNIADLVCFRDAEVKTTVVNGEVVFEDGVFQKKFPGKALRYYGN